MAAGPTSLEEIDVGRHTARQISALVGRELGLPEPEKLTPAQVVVHGKEQALRQSPDDVLSPPAKPGAGLVKLQLQQIAEALIAKRSATAAKMAAAKPAALRTPDDLPQEAALPTPGRIDQALGEIAKHLDMSPASTTSVSAPSTPDAAGGVKNARMKYLLDPNEAAGFPRGLRKTERQAEAKLDVPERKPEPKAQVGLEQRASAPSAPDAASGNKTARMKSMLDPNEAAGFPRGLRKTERQAEAKLDVPALARKPEAEAQVGPEQAAKNQQAVRALLLCQVCRSFGIMLRIQTETQIWLNAFAGDFAGQARVQGNLESISGILGFIVSPILGGLSDAYGRRPLMIMCVDHCLAP